jgi:cytochrome c nitrite reductase small subunit
MRGRGVSEYRQKIAAASLGAAALLGAAAGLGLFTVGYADSFSYLSDDPNACANCHVMQGHLDAWTKSSHGKFATCNDCHAPHDDLVAKYACKARNGFFHSLAFTTGNFPDNLLINDFNRSVTEGACRHCHSPLVHAIDSTSMSASKSGALACIQCHSTVGHDR